MTSIAGRAPWLDEPDLQRLLETLSAKGEMARVAGGAVRNALMGLGTTDVDVATTTVPEETVRRLRAAGFKTIPTGIEHGTVTAVSDAGRAFEVTTLRADVETDGRRAKVRFGSDWAADAARRDFTINALYADANGEVLDLVGASPTSKRAGFASSATRKTGSARTICASCGSFASLPGTARDARMPRGSRRVRG